MSGTVHRLLGWLWPQSAAMTAVGKHLSKPKPPVVITRTDSLFPFVVPGSSEAMLVDFTRSKASAEREREQWQAFGDEEVGGRSTYSLELIRATDEEERQGEERVEQSTHDQVHNAVAADDTGQIEGIRRRKHDSYARFSGRLDFGDGSLELPNRTLARTGYCGIRKSMRNGSESLCVQDFDILRLLIRGDGNVYNLNVRTDNFVMGDIPDYNYDLWQVSLQPKANRWMEVEIPWRAFRFTFKGKYIDEGFFDGRNIMSIGLSPFRTAMIDQGVSEFQIDIAWMKTEVQTVEQRGR